jgi:hypothetical protein
VAANDILPMVSRRRLLIIAFLGAASMTNVELVWAADLPAERPADLRLTYSRSAGRPRPGSHSIRLVVISAREPSYREDRGPGGPPPKRQTFAMTAPELDAFYAKLRKTGIDRAVTVKRDHPILDFPPSGLLIEWGTEKIDLSVTYREAASDMRAWNEAMELIDGLLKRKGL